MRTPITYYGGKQLLANKILSLIPNHKIYCEPYFGGGAVFFAKGKSFCEVINDIDNRIITFYEVCQDVVLFRQLVEKVQHTLDSEAVFSRAEMIWKDPTLAKTSVDIAWAVWLLCNMGYGGSPDGGWKWDNGTSGSHAGVVMDNYRNQFTYKVHARLKHVQISCRDALKVIAQRDTAETFFFLDPPYPGCVQKHYKGFSKEKLEELLQLLSTIKGKFLLCNFSSQLLSRYVKQNGWNVEVKDLPLLVSNHTTKGSKRKQEVMVYNYKVYPQLFNEEQTEEL